MHYRNGREAKNGDKVVRLNGGKIEAFGWLVDAVPGNDYCNGSIVGKGSVEYACLCDCLHIDDVAELLATQGLDKRPAGRQVIHPTSPAQRRLAAHLVALRDWRARKMQAALAGRNFYDPESRLGAGKD